MSSTRDPVVLAVDDDTEVLETYRLWLRDGFEVRTAPDGETALETLGDDVDVVLLDRMMPGLSGGEVLDRIREREVDPAVVMLTALDPDFDVVEMPFDAYLTKPTTREELRGAVETLIERENYSAKLRAYCSLVERRATLEANKSDAELRDHEGYARLQNRIDRLESELGEDLELDHEGFVAVAQEL
ncbi:response regulator [Haloparvum alkalitolerans]|uniref:response regulator n=1 Tax=Haloparvum alkalitolerans TaxID=1042953 RepID=UPI003CF7A7B2